MTALEIVLIIAIILFLGGIVAWRVLVHVRKRKSGGASGGISCVEFLRAVEPFRHS